MKMPVGPHKITDIVFRNFNVIEAVLNNNLVWSSQADINFFVEYTIDKPSFMHHLGDKNLDFYNYFLPTLIDQNGNEHKDYRRIEVTLTDNTKVNHLNVRQDTVKKIRLWYPIETIGLKFEQTREEHYDGIRYGSNRIKTLTRINTTNFTTMKDMFKNCEYLTSIEKSSRWLTSNVTDMSYMFAGCVYLTKTNELEKFNTSNVKNFSHMFDGAGIRSFDFSVFNTKNVEDMSYMFANCKYLTQVNMSSCDLRSLNNVEFMFYNCSLPNFSCDNIRLDALTNTRNMFYDSKIEEFSSTDWMTENLERIDCMFYGCENLKSVNLSGLNVMKLKSMSETFYNCASLETVDISNFNEAYLNDINNAFYNSEKLIEVKGLESLKFEFEPNMTKAFYNCKNIFTDISNWFILDETGQLPNISFRPNLDYTFYGCNTDTTMSAFSWNVYPISMIGTFSNNEIVSANLDNYQLYDTENLSYLFSSCKKLESVSLPKIVTFDLEGTKRDNIKYMDGMFKNCISLKRLTYESFPNFTADSLISTDEMFSECTIEYLDLSTIIGSKLESAVRMFNRCTSLKHMDMSNLIGCEEGIDTEEMLNYCYRLEFLDLSNLRTKAISPSTYFVRNYMLSNVPGSVDFNFNKYNLGYKNFTLTEYETNFSSIFPWNEKRYVLDFNGLTSVVPSKLESYYFDRPYRLKLHKNGRQGSSNFMIEYVPELYNTYPLSTCNEISKTEGRTDYSFIEFEINVDCGSLIELEYWYDTMETEPNEPDYYWNTTGFAICAGFQPSSSSELTMQATHVWKKATPERTSGKDVLTIETALFRATTLFIQIYVACRSHENSISRFAIRKISITKIEE